jgi:hypothetical protein
MNDTAPGRRLPGARRRQIFRRAEDGGYCMCQRIRHPCRRDVRSIFSRIFFMVAM